MNSAKLKGALWQEESIQQVANRIISRFRSHRSLRTRITNILIHPPQKKLAIFIIILKRDSIEVQRSKR
jgi:hypothetical protein